MAGGEANSEVELVLLERVFLRIGSAETDDQLQSVLAKFLPPVLLKLASQTDGVRKKVMELLVHINKRVKSRPKIQLPLPELLAQYKDPEASPFVTNFTIIYIKMGFPRLETTTQVELLPELVNCLEGRPLPQQDSLMQLITPVLQFVKIPPDPVKSKALFGLNEKPKTAKLMLDFMLDMLLMPYNPPSGQTKAPPAAAGPVTAAPGRPATGASATPTTTAPAGLSDATYKRVLGDNLMTPDEIEKVKLGILAFLGGDVFLDQNIVSHLVVATADNRHAVASSADRSLKKIVSSVDWNSHPIISKLYSIFQGTVVVKGQTSSVKPDHKRSPGSIQVRLKIFPYLLKSKEAANQFPACVQTVFDCLYGTNTSGRLKIMAVQFVHHLCLNCADTKFNPIGAVLLSGMVKLIGENAKEDPQLRSLAYIAVGKIARRVPQLVTKDITLLQTFFDAMCKEESENRLAVQEALSMMSPAFKKLDPSNLKLVEALLMENIDKPEPYIRQIVVKYAIAVFPTDHIPSRYMLLLACGDTKEDVYTDASKALRGVSQSEESEKQVERKMPQFADMVNYINEKATQRQKTAHKYVIGSNVLAFNPATYVEILMYLRMCLAHNAGVNPNLESTATMQTEAPLVGIYVNKLLEDKTMKGVIAVYIAIIRKLLTAIGGAPAMYCLLEIVAVARDHLASQFTKQLDWLKSFVYSSREDMREYAAQLYALIVSSDTGKRQAQIMSDLVKNLETQALEGQHGSLLVLGYLIGHIYTSRHRHVGDVTVEDMDIDDLEVSDVNDHVLRAVKKIVSLLDNSAPLLSGGACTALGEIGRCGALPLPNMSENKKVISKLSVVENLATKVQTTKENPKVREKAAVALGYFCVGEEEFPHRQKVIESLLDCAQPKQIELHFTVGESLVCASLGAASDEGRDIWLVKAEDYKTPVGEKTLKVDSVLNLLLKKYIPSANPHIRQAACIWLMAVIKGCEKQEVIQTRLKDVQAAFMALLSDNDEMTQDFASKGLGVVYEICSKEQKDELVSTLVNTLMTGKRATERKVTGDTEVFQEGALGTTPDGKGLSTYKELCSIANDLNQPDLIYKFMHLANHNAMWNSKKGAAFGFSTIAAQAGEQLAPYLHQIVPKLYRYQFDPNPRINQAMTSIWSALVTDNKKTVDKYLKEILDDLMINLTNSQWRVRESSCLALNDALRGRALDDVVDGLPQLWETLLRVRDDIKESVRKAADMACKTLSRVCIKICDPNYGSVGERATSLVLPCLLKVGLPSQVQEIRALSLATILKISQNAGALLRPHVPLLVVALLESLSGLEPQYLNYLSLHAASSQVTQSKLDNARLAASKTSPMMQAINQCVQYVDESNLGELVPRLTDLIRSGVGLGTKAGCANFIGSLVHHCPRDLGPYAGKLLGALLNGLNDRNATVKKSYAVTIGYLVKVAKDSSVEKLVLRLKEWYLEKEDEAVRYACGLTLQAMGQKSPDTLKRHASLAMPLAFLAMHQKNESDDDSSNLTDSSAIWEEVWTECTPGTEGGIRLYMTELVAISKVALQSQSWPMKAQGAAAMRKMADKLGTNLGPPHLGLVLSALLEGLQGRTWTGKEELLKAIAAICVNCKSSMSDSSPVENQPRVEVVVEAVLKESRKGSLPYKQAAIAALGEVLEVQEVDRFTEVNTILSPLIARKTNDTEDLDVNKDTLLGFQAVAFDCLGQAWPRTKETQDANQVAFCKMLGESLNTSVWKVEMAKLRTCGKLLNRLVILENENSVRSNRATIVTLIQHLIGPLCQALGNVKYSAIRTESLSVAEILIKKFTGCNQLDILDVKEADQLQKALTAMTGDNQPELADRASSLLKTITAATGTSV